MGARGPQRKPGSRRWNQEMRKSRQVGAAGNSGKAKNSPPSPSADELPACPKELPRRVSERWRNLVIDMLAAGIPVRQVDARSISIAAGYVADLVDLEEMCGDAELEAEQRLAAIRLKNQTRKDYLAALMAIGGTPVVRLRARIAPEEKPKETDDPWSEI